MSKDSITWKIGGEAGFGIMTTGVMFAKLAIRSGYNIFNYTEYPSLIRGGHNVMEVRLSNAPVYSQEKGVNLLIALNKQTVDLHQNELKDGAGLVYDPEKVTINPDELSAKIVLLPIPLTKIIKEAGASPVMQNNVTLGASCALFNLDLNILFKLIEDEFGRKGEKVVAENKKSAELGYQYVVNNLKGKFAQSLSLSNTQKLMVLSGNEAIGLGAIAAGCKFFCAYPMTPTSNLLSFLAEKAEKVGIVVKHAEDEIAVINMAIGASFAGVRSMVGTSGGGFSLMVEGLGLSGITETPVVITMGQRPGPATGMPTWTGQADLKFLINASQDEFLRIILAPGDVAEAFTLTVEAFNLADIYQTPVFILCDKYLCEGYQSTPLVDSSKINIDRGKTILKVEDQNITNYKRYQATLDGISPRLLPGTKGLTFIANSYEHEENGLSTEDSAERAKQVNKRNQKALTYQKNTPEPKLYGQDSADITLIGWGSTKGPVLQALTDINYQQNGKSINFLHLTHVWPLNNKALTEILGKAKKKVMIEGNSFGQMEQIIREQTGIVMDDRFLKYDGRPFYPEEIITLLSRG